MPSFIIAEYVWQILGRGVFVSPPHPWAAPKMPILNRVNNHSFDIVHMEQLWIRSIKISGSFNTITTYRFRCVQCDHNIAFHCTRNDCGFHLQFSVFFSSSLDRFFHCLLRKFVNTRIKSLLLSLLLSSSIIYHPWYFLMQATLKLLEVRFTSMLSSCTFYSTEACTGVHNKF